MKNIKKIKYKKKYAYFNQFSFFSLKISFDVKSAARGVGKFAPWRPPKCPRRRFFQKVNEKKTNSAAIYLAARRFGGAVGWRRRRKFKKKCREQNRLRGAAEKATLM